MADIEIFKEKLHTLISKFEKDKRHYLSKGYLEAQLRIDFLNPLFEALAWDIENKAHKPFSPIFLEASFVKGVDQPRLRDFPLLTQDMIHYLIIKRNCF